MKRLFEKLRKKHFPVLETELTIMRRKLQGKRTIDVIAHYDMYSDKIFIKSWANLYEKNRLKSILIHEMVHAMFGKDAADVGHGKKFALLLLKTYKEEFPTSYRLMLRTQYWLIQDSNIVNGRYIPPRMENGLKMMRVYHPSKVDR